jgi:hypothetical protein
MGQRLARTVEERFPVVSSEKQRIAWSQSRGPASDQEAEMAADLHFCCFCAGNYR